MELKLYNSLSRKIELFKPIKPGKVGMYTCGPTVYNYAHLGNFRTYLLGDILKRVLVHNKYQVTQVMNLTDVDDKTIRASQQQHITLTELTKNYEYLFFEEAAELNILKPEYTLKATESIKEMIALIKTLLKKGYAYRAEDGIYFSVSKSKGYGKLVSLEKVRKTKARILADEYDKAQARDFALWKFHTKEDGPVFWETEIGKGRPGWHIECSAMSMKILGTHFDLHVGGQDLLFPHHTNEIAQSEAATGKKFVNYWVHSALLAMKDAKMSKSRGNILLLKDLKEQKYSPLHYRYLCLQTHYRKPLQFSFENLDAAKQGHERIRRKILTVRKLPLKGKDNSKEMEQQFHEAINDDLNIPLALQIFLKALDDDTFDSKKKLALLEHFDAALGLGIKDMKEEKRAIPRGVQALLDAREEARKKKLWAEADILRQRIKEQGYEIEDTPRGPKVEKM